MRGTFPVPALPLLAAETVDDTPRLGRRQRGAGQVQPGHGAQLGHDPVVPGVGAWR